MIRWELSKSALEGVDEPDVRRPVPRFHAVGQIDRARSDLSTSQPVPTGVDENPPEPGVQSLRVAQAGHTAPGHADGIVGRLLRVAAVPDDGEGESVPAVKVAFQMLGKGAPSHLHVDGSRAGPRASASRLCICALVDHPAPFASSERPNGRSSLPYQTQWPVAAFTLSGR